MAPLKALHVGCLFAKHFMCTCGVLCHVRRTGLVAVPPHGCAPATLGVLSAWSLDSGAPLVALHTVSSPVLRPRVMATGFLFLDTAAVPVLRLSPDLTASTRPGHRFE